jgi:hypothetical protein
MSTELLQWMYRAEMSVVRIGLGLHVAAITGQPDGAVSLAIAMAELDRFVEPNTRTTRALAYAAECSLDRDHCGDAKQICRALFLAPESDC